MPPPPYFSIPKVFPHQRWGKLDSGPSFKRAAHRLGRSSRPDSEGSPGGGGDGKGGRDGAGPPVLPPTRQTDLAWLPGTAAPPPTTTHTHAHKVLARGGMPGWVGMGRPHGCRGAGPSGIQRWEGCPSWGGHPGISASPWQKEGGSSSPSSPPR